MVLAGPSTSLRLRHGGLSPPLPLPPPGIRFASAYATAGDSLRLHLRRRRGLAPPPPPQRGGSFIYYLVMLQERAKKRKEPVKSGSVDATPNEASSEVLELFFSNKDER
ncbi:hypothetical protein ABZP36_003269 [Zizania latifolia]